MDNSNSIDLCYNVITDGSTTGDGFRAVFSIDYENPERVEWKNTYDQSCFTRRPSQPDAQWDGSCDIGIQQRVIAACNEVNVTTSKQKSSTSSSFSSSAINNIKFVRFLFLFYLTLFTYIHIYIYTYIYVYMYILPESIEKTKELERGYCHIGDVQTKYCVKKACSNSRSISKSVHFNGMGRIDPVDADPFTIHRSTNEEFAIQNMVNLVTHAIKQLEREHLDNQFFSGGVTQWSGLEDSKWRLGIKLARSLLLGDSFTAAFTGSSLTAGRDNLFLSSYPMQLQSLLSPLWKEIGYKGAAFVVKNRAIDNDHIRTNQISWCLPELVGEDPDVVFWEDTTPNNLPVYFSTVENHLRSTISLRRKPVWHAVIGRPHGSLPTRYQNLELSSLYIDLADYYQKSGVGIVEFRPSNFDTLAAQNSKYKQEQVYVSWYPGPRGHRYYAQIIAYFYLNALLDVLKDIQPAIQAVYYYIYIFLFIIC
ncbi:hypothetical protein RFI_13148 [Reticulomyxa filosa]|uniref:Uncharacterized protein n=1 Tax=Reticulomyxa filosa TaxID=46433 RepID=X6NDE5_RETFI|nr:hypothetical protein RFI_13148 [Reticulomyxa filosa]|eukprot:ETO24011.1 hypothetical protein RFI_13148 [Reticulomyxa filosa]